VQTIKQVENHSQKREVLELAHHAQRSKLQFEWDLSTLFLIPNFDIVLAVLEFIIHFHPDPSTMTIETVQLLPVKTHFRLSLPTADIFLIACCWFALRQRKLSLAELEGTSYPIVSVVHVHMALSISLQFSRSTRALIAQFLRQIVTFATNALAIIAFTDYFSMFVLVC
jgi:hypothetical protein